MTNKVLIGKVKNELQLKVNLEEKFYHIPEAVMPKNILPWVMSHFFMRREKRRRSRRSASAISER